MTKSNEWNDEVENALKMMLEEFRKAHSYSDAPDEPATDAAPTAPATKAPAAAGAH
jgi:hypothetical protein